jgi:hypothetical protein
MARYVTWGQTSGAPGNTKNPAVGGNPFESSCGWFNECDFAHLCVDCSKDTGPNCPTTKQMPCGLFQLYHHRDGAETPANPDTGNPDTGAWTANPDDTDACAWTEAVATEAFPAGPGASWHALQRHVPW